MTNTPLLAAGITFIDKRTQDRLNHIIATGSSTVIPGTRVFSGNLMNAAEAYASHLTRFASAGGPSLP